jgi:peptidyl-tRNA hydrolase, PTH1 family
MAEPSLTLFLGNPGRAYEKTRHNFAWMVSESLVEIKSLAMQKKFHGSWGSFHGKDHREIILFPETYMNKSGESAAQACSFFRIDVPENPQQLLVVHDDLELPFGTIELRKGGGLAGHNGLKSIRNHLKTPDFLRLRLGIGRPPRGDISSWVLSRFSPDQEAVLPRIIGEAAAAVREMIFKGHTSVEPFRRTVTEPV